MKCTTTQIIILFLFISITILNSQVINDEEYNCLLQIGIKFNDARYTEEKIIDICSTLNCTSDGHLLYLSINGLGGTLYRSDVECFLYLESLFLYNLTLEDDFLYNPIGSVNSIELPYVNNINIYKELPSYKIIRFQSPFKAKVDISYFKNVEVLTYTTTTLNGYLDLIPSSSSFLGETINLQLATNFYPDLSNFPKLTTLIITDSTEGLSQGNNILSYKNIYSLGISCNGSIPVELTQIDNPQYQKLLIDAKAQVQNLLPLDFSNKKEIDIISFEISLGSKYSGIFPIKKLPLVKINSLVIKNAIITNPLNYSMFDNVKDLTLFNLGIKYKLPPATEFKNTGLISIPYNSFYGTIDESWCHVNFQMYKNNISGTLPDCIRCFINDYNVMQKLFPNPDLDFSFSCSPEKIIPNIKIDNGYVYLFGMNLGFFSSNIITIPKINFEAPLKHNSLFRGQLEDPIDSINYDTINVFFTYPGYNYTLSINQDIGPNVTSLIQNNSLITIEGSFFSYNLSDIQVIIGDGSGAIKCSIVSCTFNQIKCSIIQVEKSETKNIYIKVKGLSTSTKSLINKVIYECLPSDCNANGKCNLDTGVCECQKGWLSIGSNICQVPDHYLYSNTQVSSSSGGIIQLFGWFGNLHNQLSITIGELNCEIIKVEDSLIECSISGGSGMKTIIISQNTLKWSGLIYPYYDPIYICPNNCGGPAKGKCDTSTGECKCISTNYIGFDCQSINTTSNSTTTITDDGSIIISDNQYVEFLMSIDSIIEYDINLNPVHVKNLTNKWNKLYIEDNNSTLSLFSQAINEAVIILTIEEVPKFKIFSFAGSNFTIDAGGVKVSINITNWNYSNTLNYLQLVLSTTLDDHKEEDDQNSDCNEETVIESSSNSNSLQDNINYLKISKYGKSLYGRFQNKMLSNQIPTIITTKIKSQNNTNVVLTIDLPHCIECILDPDFSVLINPDSKIEVCKDKKKWLLPVVIILPVVFVAVTIASVIYYIKKKKNKEFLIKLSNLNK